MVDDKTAATMLRASTIILQHMHAQVSFHCCARLMSKPIMARAIYKRNKFPHYAFPPRLYLESKSICTPLTTHPKLRTSTNRKRFLIRSCPPRGWLGAGVGVGMLRGRGGSWFLGFKVSRFQGFLVQQFRGFKVSWFRSFLVSKF